MGNNNDEDYNIFGTGSPLFTSSSDDPIGMEKDKEIIEKKGNFGKETKIAYHVGVFDLLDAQQASEYEGLMSEVLNERKKYSLVKNEKIAFQKTESYFAFVEYMEKID